MSEGRILIADDEKEILDVLEMLLVENGYEVVRASNGRQALEHPSEDIDLYILDVNMPEMSGFAAGSEIRRRSDTPMIFLTAYAGESDKYLGFSAGADDYIVKPFSNTELLMRVKAILRRTIGKADISVAKGGSDMNTTDGEAVRISGTNETNTAGNTIIYKMLILYIIRLPGVNLRGLIIRFRKYTQDCIVLLHVLVLRQVHTILSLIHI